MSLGRKYSFFQHLGSVLRFLLTKRRGWGRGRGLLVGSARLLVASSLPNAGTQLSAALAAEALAPRLPCEMQGATSAWDLILFWKSQF